MERILSREQIDSGSNYNFPDKMEINPVNRSVFNLSHTKTMTIPNGGVIIPLTWFECLKGDSFDIEVNHLIRVLPQVVPLMSRQRIFIHAFAMYYGDMQSDFQVLMTKGMNGNKVKKIAPLTTSNLDSSIYDSGSGVVTPESLADYLELPQGASYSDLIDSGISALPFFMYELIYIHYYMNRNFYMDNENYIPDDIESMRMDENGNILCNTDSNHPYITLGKLHYRDYPDDYLLSCLPFQQRGDRPTLNVDFTAEGLFNFTYPLTANLPYEAGSTGDEYIALSGDSLNADTTSPYTIKGTRAPKVINGFGNELFLGTYGGSYEITPLPETSQNYKKGIIEQQNKIFNDAVKGRINAGIGLDDLRQLAREQHELELMARTDGSYYEMGLTFFGSPFKTAHKNRPILIGTTYSQLSFTEVVQTGATSTGGALGTQAGHGISISNNGRIGKFNAEDYGIIMIVASIMPDVFYCQNLQKKWFRKYQSEFFLPGREKMGLQPVLNKEAFFSGIKATDDDLFAYQNPFDDLRYIANGLAGKVADPNNASFSPYTQARFLNSTPTYSQSFAIADDVPKEYLFAPSESAYVAQFHFNIRAVRPLPYKAVPMDFGA